jgi:sodium/bile acid cotransporter 7
MGVPLINAIYEDNPLIGYYTLPLLIWHPMQLVIGSALAPKLSAFVAREEERLQRAIITDDLEMEEGKKEDENAQD